MPHALRSSLRSLAAVLAIAMALALLLVSLQIVRGADALTSLGIRPVALTAALGLPALLTVTLPVALFAVSAVRIAEAAESGEILAASTLGMSQRHWLRGLWPTWAAGVVLLAPLIAWGAPAALAEARNVIVSALVASAESRSTVERPLSVESFRTTLEGHKVSLTDVTVRADRLTVRADRLTVRLPRSARERIDRWVPVLETRGIDELLARRHDSRARGQLFKRGLLMTLTPLALALLCLGIARWRPLWRVDRALVAALATGGCVFLVARSAELAARISGLTGAFVGVSVVAISLATTWRLWSLD